jgi:hypothetical protein
MSAKEQWRPIPHFQNYAVSSWGRVINIKRKRPLKACPSDTKYLYVVLQQVPLKQTIAVHRLVLLAFRGPCPKGHEACHRDGSRQNNHLSNLRWGTKQSNAHDQQRHGRIPNRKGERHPCAKLTTAQVQYIKTTQTSARILAREYKISCWTIYDIRKGRRWSHV